MREVRRDYEGQIHKNCAQKEGQRKGDGERKKRRVSKKHQEKENSIRTRERKNRGLKKRVFYTFLNEKRGKEPRNGEETKQKGSA